MITGQIIRPLDYALCSLRRGSHVGHSQIVNLMDLPVYMQPCAFDALEMEVVAPIAYSPDE